MLFFRNAGPENYQRLSPDQRQHFVARWNAWYDRLVEQGKAAGGEPLEPETRLISGAGGQRIVDGPFAEAKEAIAGYVKVLVRDRDEATAIARLHPGLDYGMVIEVREATQHCHLGVEARNPVLPAAALA